MVLKLPKIVHILQICVDLSKKSKSNEAVYLYPSERSYHVLSGKSLCYRHLSSRYLGLKYRKSAKSAEI